MAEDNVVVEPGDMLLLHTGFATEVLNWNRDPDPVKIHRTCTYLDARDPAMLEWIAESQISALIADNYAVEGMVGYDPDESRHSLLPDPPPLPVPPRRPARRAVVPARARDVAPRAQQEPLPVDCPSAPAARRLRVAGDAGSDRVTISGRRSIPLRAV